MQVYDKDYKEVVVIVKMGTSKNLSPREIADIVDSAVSFYMEEGYYLKGGKKVDFSLEVEYEDPQ